MSLYCLCLRKTQSDALPKDSPKHLFSLFRDECVSCKMVYQSMNLEFHYFFHVKIKP